MASPFAPVFLQLPDNNVFLDPNNFDSAVVSHGVKLVHYRGLPCPVGRVDLHDARRPHADHEGCTNGYLYVRAGVVKALFQGNSKEKRRADFGFLDASVATITVPRWYLGTTEEVLLAVADRLTLEDTNVTVPRAESARASGAGSDRLSWPVVRVQDLVDASGERYVEGVDFAVRDGRIVWGRRRPSSDPATGMPAVFAVRYLLTPSFYVSHLVHELRIGQSPVTGTIRMPQQAMVVREHIWRARQDDPEASAGDPSRQAQQPADGGTGPR